MLRRASEIFNINTTIEIEIFDPEQEFIPKTDEHYYFDQETTNAIIAAFKYNKKLLIQGFHGTGKSTHIEQVAARLNWPLVRINLDGQISRNDLVGRDVIRIKDGLQITEFSEGILPWAMRQGIALILDEYDACRPEVAFVLNSILEPDGTLALLEKNQTIYPHKNFRIFATSNTIGL
ncbi:MAG: AAA family ATPase [Alphaproteobacteria bacterium]